MGDLGGTKIKKKAYSFELKKKYQHAAHYRMKERPPIEKIKDAFRGLFTPKKEEKKFEAPLAAAPPKGGFNFVVFGAFALIGIIVLGLAGLFLYIQSLPTGVVITPQQEKSVIDNTVVSGEILTTGELTAQEHVAAVLVDYRTSDLKNYSIQLSTYDGKIPSEVFLLTPEYVDEASNYSEFVRILRSNLAKRKIILNDISIKQIEVLPQGAVVIIPTGTVPKEILGVDSRVSINKLADRGVVFIYVGKSFREMLNGTTTVFTPKDVSDKLPFAFNEGAPLESTGDFRLFQPLYSVIPKSGWKNEIIYGSVSMATRGDGAFIFLPQTLDGGWRANAQLAADDVSKIIFETPWAVPNAEPKIYEFTNQTNYSGTRFFFSAPFKSSNATVKVDFVGYPPTSNSTVRETLYIRLEKPNNNSLIVESAGRVVPAYVTNEPVRMNARLREATAAQPNMYLIIQDVNGTEIQNNPQGNINLQGDRSFDIQVFADRGEYLVKLVDDESKVYAEGYMKVVSIDITRSSKFDPQKRSVYIFDVTMDGTPRTLTDVTVKVDGGQYGTYAFQNVNEIRVDVSQYVGNEFLPLGQHTFEFTSGGLKATVPVEHTRPKTFFEEPIFWVSILLTGGLVAVGAIFARQESVFYALDIPDFPPIARTRIALTPDVILSIFSKVNETYRWQNTPLTPAEIKNGFKDIFVKGKPVYITDYNVEFLLDDLVKRGHLRESLGYYGLLEWEEKSKHTIGYLALLRRLRDICVNNAIPFTAIDESKEADSEITVVGQTMSIHFYERSMDVKRMFSRVLPTIGKGIAIIMFRNNSDKEQFQKLINSSPSIAPLIVKMEADSSSLLFLTGDELEKMLLEFKSM